MTTEAISNIPKKSPLDVSSVDFMESYNKTLPAGFPRLTGELLKKFRVESPAFFKDGELWSIDKHRKAVVDWFQVL
jgi:hypothetical protein